MPLIEIPDDFQVYRFAGHQLGEPVSTAFDRYGVQRPRWLEARLFAKNDGGYVLAQANKSLVWHLPDAAGHVRKPALIPSAKLPDGAIYCGTIPPKPGRQGCPPPRVQDPFGSGGPAVSLPPRVMTELPQRRVFDAEDVDSLLRQVATFRRHGPGGSSLALSAPMRQLFASAALADPAFTGKVVVDL